MAGARGDAVSGRVAWRLLRGTGASLSGSVIGWMSVGILMPALMAVGLAFVVGAIPSVLAHGMNSAAGRHLLFLLVVATPVYWVLLLLDPVGSALSTAARQRVAGRLQARLLTAVCAPPGVQHLEDRETLDQLARAEGSLTGYFPGDVPVTWGSFVARRVCGIAGCVVVSVYIWWLGPLLLLMWLGVRRVMLAAVAGQAIKLRDQTLAMRRAAYFTGVATKPRDAKEVRVFGLAGFVAGRYRTEFTEATRASHTGLRRIHRLAAACFVVVLAGYGAALWVIAEAARGHEIGLRTLAILVPMLSVTMFTGNVLFGDITFAWTLAALPDVDELESELVAAPMPGTADPGAAPRTSIRFRDVRFRYPGGTRDVLAGIDLELAAGTSTALVGANGAGKSTLVSLLARLRDPTGGAIDADGADLRGLDPARWQRLIALMPQQPVRYPVSAYDNVAFGALEHAGDREGVLEAARLADFAAVAENLPRGWDTVLSRELPGGAELSGGQWQRLALARALFATAHGARLLVLDEPTAALDARSEARFYERFHEITAGLTTLVISHRFATVRRAEQIAVLDGGVITERGSHQDLLGAGGTYATMYAVQAARFGR